MKDSLEQKKNVNRNQIEQPKSRKPSHKKKASYNRKKIISFVIFIIIAIGVVCFFLLSNNDLLNSTNNEDSLSKNIESLSNVGKNKVETYQIDEGNILLTVSPIMGKAKEDSKEDKKNAEGFNKLFHFNSNNNKSELITHSNKSLSLVKLDNSYIFEIKETKEKLLVVFDYTTAKKEDGSSRKIIEHGYVYSIKKDKIEQVYKTPYLFGNAVLDNGKLVLYERLPMDETNMYPSYLKPYERVKMVYENGKFSEKQRDIVEPIKEYSKTDKK